MAKDKGEPAFQFLSPEEGGPDMWRPGDDDLGFTVGPSQDVVVMSGGWVYVVEYSLNGVMHDVEGVYVSRDSARLGALHFIQHQRTRLMPMAGIEQESNTFTSSGEDATGKDLTLTTLYRRMRLNR